MSLTNNNLQNEEEINDLCENKDDKTIQEQQIKNTDQLLTIICEDLNEFVPKHYQKEVCRHVNKNGLDNFYQACKEGLEYHKKNIDNLHKEMTKNEIEPGSVYNTIKESLSETLKNYYADSALFITGEVLERIPTKIKECIDGLKNKIETSKKNVNKIKIEEKPKQEKKKETKIEDKKEEKTEEKKESKKEDKKIEVKKEIKIEPMKVKNNIEKKQKKSNKKSFKEINFEQIIKSCTERESVDVKKCISIIKQQYYDFKDAEEKLLLNIIKKQKLKAINIPTSIKIEQYEDKDVFVNTPKHFSNDVNGKLKFSKNESNLQNTKSF